MRSVHVRLLPWRPHMRTVSLEGWDAAGMIPTGGDDPLGWLLRGLLPRQLVLRTAEGDKRYVAVTGIRRMLEVRRYYRSLRAR